MHAVGLLSLSVCVCVCVGGGSAEQSEAMSVSGEQIDEHTQQTKKPAQANTHLPQTKPATGCNSANTSKRLLFIRQVSL